MPYDGSWPTAGPPRPVHLFAPRPFSPRPGRPLPTHPVAPPLQRHQLRLPFRRYRGIAKKRAHGRPEEARAIAAALAAALAAADRITPTTTNDRTDAFVEALSTRAFTDAAPAPRGALAAHGEDNPFVGGLPLPSPAPGLAARSPFPADTSSVAQGRRQQRQQQRREYDALAVSLEDLGLEDEDEDEMALDPEDTTIPPHPRSRTYLLSLLAATTSVASPRRPAV